MLSEIIIFISSIVLLYVYFFRNVKKNFPPGEWGKPIVGYQMKKEIPINISLENLRQKHGDIFMIKTGQRLVLYLADYNIIKTAMSKLEFSGRPDQYSLGISRNFKHNAGVTGAKGQLWHTNRRFLLKILRDYGLGKSTLSTSIEMEAKHLIQELLTADGKPNKLDWSLNLAVVNVLMKMVFGMRFDLADPVHRNYVNFISDTVASIGGTNGLLLNNYPILLKLPKFIQNKLFNIDKYLSKFEELRQFSREVIQKHLRTLDVNAKRDFLDSYIIEHDKEKNNEGSIYTDDKYEDLIQICIDLYIAGSETTSSSIRWHCLFMASYPDIQKKVQAELDQIEPSSTNIPNYSDKDKLPYFQATIYEAQRYTSLAAVGLPHITMKDAIINGYDIPKDTIVYPCVEMCHRNKKYWKFPDKYYPEHFINQEGEFFVPEEGFLPFGIGRRQCLGESLAKMQLFIFLFGLLKSFTIKPPKDKKLNLQPNPLAIGRFNFPIIQELVFEQRK